MRLLTYVFATLLVICLGHNDQNDSIMDHIIRIEKTMKEMLQRETTVDKTMKELLQRESTVENTQKQLLQRQSTVENTMKELLQRESTVENTQRQLLQRESIVENTQRQLLQREINVENTMKQLLQRQSNVDKAISQILQRQSNVEKKMVGVEDSSKKIIKNGYSQFSVSDLQWQSLHMAASKLIFHSLLLIQINAYCMIKPIKFSHFHLIACPHIIFIRTAKD